MVIVDRPAQPRLCFKAAARSKNPYQWRLEGIVLRDVKLAPIPTTIIWRVRRALYEEAPGEDSGLVATHMYKGRRVGSYAFQFLAQACHCLPRWWSAASPCKVLILGKVSNTPVVVENLALRNEAVVHANTTTSRHSTSSGLCATLETEHATTAARHLVATCQQTFWLLLYERPAPWASPHPEVLEGFRRPRREGLLPDIVAGGGSSQGFHCGDGRAQPLQLAGL
mmetsp:Transcript_2823/g.5582  ORF Transcript_2823/g.5582 Transcript_2823/m.5582 type:complete len:225 (+) Transcript_2823:350-1024(+)